MERPEVGPATELVYEALGPYTKPDAEHDWELLRWVDGRCRAIFARIYELVADRDDRLGWTIVFNPETCPAYALPYLAQVPGVKLDPEMTEQEMRDAIATPENWARGRTSTIRLVMQRHLTGARRVLIVERFEGNAYRQWVRTFESETPDSDRTLADYLSQKPGGLTYLLEVITGQAYDDLPGKFDDYDEMAAAYATYDDARADEP